MRTFTSHFGRKFISLFIAVALLTAPVAHLSVPNTVEAGGPLGGALEITQLRHTAINSVNMQINEVSAFMNTQSALLDAISMNREFVLDGIFYWIAKVVLQTMTESLILWINSGFNGSPTFIEDLDEYLITIADREVSDFLFGEESPLTGICEPFQDSVANAVTQEFAKRMTDRAEGYQTSCSAAEAGADLEAFFAGDFIGGGGWATWYEVTQNPEQNTAVGAYFETEQVLTEIVARAEQDEREVLEWGSGFMSLRDCIEVVGEACAEYGPINTPGTLLENQLNNYLGSSVDTLNMADEVNEVIAALLAQLVNQTLQGGLTAMSETIGEVTAAVAETPPNTIGSEVYEPVDPERPEPEPAESTETTLTETDIQAIAQIFAEEIAASTAEEEGEATEDAAAGETEGEAAATDETTNP